MVHAFSSNIFASVTRAIESAVLVPLDEWIYFPATGKYALGVSQRTHDQQLISRINNIISTKMKMLPSFLEKDFSGTPPQAIEREAAHSFWVRVFIYNSQIPAETQKFIETMNEDQKRVALAYLSAIDQGRDFSRSKYSEYYPRIEHFANEFISQADRDEQAYYETSGLLVPDTLVNGNRVRPMDGAQRIQLGPKFHRHPVTALMLAEFRRDLLPRAQKGIDTHFHLRNMQSRPEEIMKMKEGPKTTTQVGSATVTTYAMPVQIEFFPNRKITEQPSYLTDIQGAGTLTTHGLVKEYSFENSRPLYLIQYRDYKTTPMTEKYLVSETIPIGAAGETYEAELDFESAQFKILEHSERI